MEYLIKPNSEGIFTEKESGKVMVSSRAIAEAFGKSHSEVLEEIDNLIEEINKLDDSEDFTDLVESNLIPGSYKDANGKDKPCYNMTHTGFHLYMTSEAFCLSVNEHPGAMRTVEKYLMAFTAMENYVDKFYNCYEEFPEYAEAIKEHYEREGKMPDYAFSNESDMINRIVLDMPEEEFEGDNGIEEYARHILPYLGKKQTHRIKLLRAMDIAYLEMDLPYKERMRKLERYETRKGWNAVAKRIQKGDE